VTSRSGGGAITATCHVAMAAISQQFDETVLFLEVGYKND